MVKNKHQKMCLSYLCKVFLKMAQDLFFDLPTINMTFLIFSLWSSRCGSTALQNPIFPLPPAGKCFVFFNIKKDLVFYKGSNTDMNFKVPIPQKMVENV